MAPQNPRPFRQQGYILFEVLTSMLIFAVGVLGILGLMAVDIKNSSSAQYRIDACLLANDLIGQMWGDNRTPANLQAKYQGGKGADGIGYTAWLTDITNNNRLPGVIAGLNAPIVELTTINGSSPPTTAKSLVVITLFWQLPGEPQHSYIAVTEIK